MHRIYSNDGHLGNKGRRRCKSTRQLNPRVLKARACVFNSNGSKVRCFSKAIGFQISTTNLHPPLHPDALEPVLRKKLEKARKKHGGNDHEDVQELIGHLGELCQRLGRLDEADALLSESLDTARRTKGEEDWDVCTMSNNLSTVYRLQVGRCKLDLTPA